MTLAPLADLLEAHPLPPVLGDKHERGSVAVVAGSVSCPGAAILSGLGALRAGAGRVQLVVDPALVIPLGVAFPEAFVVGCDGPEGVCQSAAQVLGAASCVLIGPGLEPGADVVARAVAAVVSPATPIVLDALALPCASELAPRRLMLTPNPEEAMQLLGRQASTAETARQLGRRFGCPVAVRGERTILAFGSREWFHDGPPTLGTAGSGDVLAGLTAGFAARGVPDHVALAWAIATHAMAGIEAGSGRSNSGFLARELLDRVPAAIERLRQADAALG